LSVPNLAAPWGFSLITFELLDSKNIVSRNIVLPDGVDPGDLTQRQAERYMA